MSKNQRAPLSVRMSGELFAKLDAAVEREGIPRNALVTSLIEQGLRALESMHRHGGPVEAVKAEVAQTLSDGQAEQLPYDPQIHETVKYDPGPSINKPKVPVAQDMASTQPTTEPTPEHKWHRFNKPDEWSVEYRQGTKYAHHHCECGKRSEEKMRVK